MNNILYPKDKVNVIKLKVVEITDDAYNVIIEDEDNENSFTNGTIFTFNKQFIKNNYDVKKFLREHKLKRLI